MTERVYDEKRLSKPMEYVQPIGILKYKHNIACSPREINVRSRNYETTDEDIETDEKQPVLRTHRVRTAKYSSIQCNNDPNHQKFKSNLFSLVFLDGEDNVKVTNQIDDAALMKEFSRIVFVNGEIYSHKCACEEDYL